MENSETLLLALQKRIDELEKKVEKFQKKKSVIINVSNEYKKDNLRN